MNDTTVPFLITIPIVPPYCSPVPTIPPSLLSYCSFVPTGPTKITNS